MFCILFQPELLFSRCFTETGIEAINVECKTGGKNLMQCRVSTGLFQFLIQLSYFASFFYPFLVS